LSLLRCSMSSAVIGSPLTITTTCWALAAVASIDAPNTRIIAVASLRQVVKLSNIIGSSASSPMGAGTLLSLVRRDPPPVQPLYATHAWLVRGAEHPGIDHGNACGLGARSAAKRTQAELHHIAVVDRHAAAIRIACNVVQGQDEAVVDVSEADLGLSERFVVNVIPRCPQEHPVRVDLEPHAAEDALAAFEESDQRLRGIVAVHDHGLPAAEVGSGLQLGALKREVVLGKTEARGEGQQRIRLVRCARYVIRLPAIEPTVEAGVGRAAERKRVQSVDLVGLAEQEVDVSTLIELGGILDARIHPAAAFHAVPTGKLIDLEQI